MTWLVDHAPDLAHVDARRYLGAGRQEDEGDLWVFPDVAIQVKNWKLSRIGQALVRAAEDSVSQARRSRMRFAVGMVKYPNTRGDKVRWLASWMTNGEITTPAEVGPIEFKMVGRALDWVRDDDGPYGYSARERAQRIALLHGNPDIYVAPFEAWLGLYREAVSVPVLAKAS